MTTKTLLHLTDLHVFADRTRRHYDSDPFDNLQQVLQTSLQARTPDVILLSGDLCQDESAGGYEQLSALFGEIPAAVLALPGNHDDLTLMQTHLRGANIQVLGDVSQGEWRIVAANCAVAGKVYGRFGASRLADLDQTLNAAPEAPTVLSFHQPPIACGSEWLDQSMLQDADELAALLQAHPQVKVILCGHIHQPLEIDWQVGEHAVRVMTTPSTARQFGVQQDPFTLTDEAPGWRWLTLAADGSAYETAVVRLSA